MKFLKQNVIPISSFSVELPISNCQPRKMSCTIEYLCICFAKQIKCSQLYKFTEKCSLKRINDSRTC